MNLRQDLAAIAAEHDLSGVVVVSRGGRFSSAESVIVTSKPQLSRNLETHEEQLATIINDTTRRLNYQPVACFLFKQKTSRKIQSLREVSLHIVKSNLLFQWLRSTEPILAEPRHGLPRIFR